MKKHGMYGSPTYKSWDCMVQRCTNPKNKNFPDYGGSGVSVCDRWRDFVNFYADMGCRPEGTSLDRKDNALGYEPDNCRWADAYIQRKNQRRASLSLEQAATVRAMREETGFGAVRIARALGFSVGAVSGIIFLGNLSPR
jgi:hypothetical protein